MSDDFVRDLELELTAAARRIAAGERAPGRRPLVPWARRALPVLAAVLVAAALVTVVALVAGGGEDRTADRGDAPPPAPAAVDVPLLDSQPPARSCRQEPLGVRSGLTDVAVLRAQQHEADAIADPSGFLPIRTFDTRDPRRVLDDPAVHLVPTQGVPEGGRCQTDAGAGYCLVEDATRRFRCFPQAALARGEVLMRLSTGQIAGVVPDGVERVSVDAVDADVRRNAYVVTVPPPGDSVRLAFEIDEGCTHSLSQLLADRLPLLGSASSVPLPRAGAARLEALRSQVARIDTDGAVLWGERDGLAVWLVPAVSREAGSPCAPADGACLVALPADAGADAECVAPLEPRVRWAPLPGGRTMVFGFAERDETALRVLGSDEEASVPARYGVAAGVIPFRVDTPPVFQPVRNASVTVTVTGADPGHAAGVVRRLERSGLHVRDRVTDGLAPGDATIVWWRDRAHFGEANEVAELVGADDLRMVDGSTPRGVFQAGGDVVVQVGAEGP